jgi:hypothetical protein
MRRIPPALISVLAVALAACSPSAPEAPEEPAAPMSEEPAPLPDPATDKAPVEAETLADPAPAPRPTSTNGCELVTLPGHTENPGKLNSRFVPGPTVEVCQQQRLPVPPPAAPYPSSTEADPAAGRTQFTYYAVA